MKTQTFLVALAVLLLSACATQFNGGSNDTQLTADAGDQVQTVPASQVAAPEPTAEDRYNLAVRLKNGVGVAKDIDKARVLFQQAADMGHVSAATWVGWDAFNRDCPIETHVFTPGSDCNKTSNVYYRKALDRFNSLSNPSKTATSNAAIAARELGYQAWYFERNFPVAAQFYEQALKLTPEDARLNYFYGLMILEYTKTSGRSEEDAAGMLRKAIAGNYKASAAKYLLNKHHLSTN